MKYFAFFILLMIGVSYAVNYCVNDSVLAENNTYIFCDNGNCTSFSVYNEKVCSDGCDYKTSSCNMDGFYRILIILLIILFIIIIMVIS